VTSHHKQDHHPLPPTPSNTKAIDAILFKEDNFTVDLSARGKKIHKQQTANYEQKKLQDTNSVAASVQGKEAFKGPQ
jgi:hypothetical protein